jgi:hypothetical protein
MATTSNSDWFISKKKIFPVKRILPIFRSFGHAVSKGEEF